MEANKKYRLIAVCSFLLGTISLLVFFHFIIFGPFNLVTLSLAPAQAILLDSILLTLFFTQHSLMIRKSVRTKVESYIPKESFYAFHCICTSILLLAVTLLWQSLEITIFSIPKPYSYLCNLATLTGVAGLIWAIVSLKHFDPFGRKQIADHLKGNQLQELQFTVSGPYHLTRHPFYFFILLMIWSYPALSLDRLLFNLAWTAWVVIGTLLEEKDLEDDIGDEYAEYKRKVPMLIPYKRKNLDVS